MSERAENGQKLSTKYGNTIQNSLLHLSCHRFKMVAVAKLPLSNFSKPISEHVIFPFLHQGITARDLCIPNISRVTF